MNKNNKTCQVKKCDTAVLAALRRRIDVLERGMTEAPERPPHPLGVPEIDTVLPGGGGLPSCALHEITSDGTRNDAIAFCAALLAGTKTDAGENTGAAVRWCRGGDDLYAPGLSGFGLDLGRLLVVRVQRDRDLLWVMEEGLRSGTLAAVVAEPSKVTTTALRRLQLAAEAWALSCATIETRWLPGRLPPAGVSTLLSAGRCAWGRLCCPVNPDGSWN